MRELAHWYFYRIIIYEREREKKKKIKIINQKLQQLSIDWELLDFY